jgi:hypothetical protein
MMRPGYSRVFYAFTAHPPLLESKGVPLTRVFGTCASRATPKRRGRDVPSCSPLRQSGQTPVRLKNIGRTRWIIVANRTQDAYIRSQSPHGPQGLRPVQSLDVNGGNMIYKVKARVIDETIGEFYRKLADGTVAKQRPDGEEIVASMKRAVLTGPGVAEWYETCFCPTPLYHERQTQYDFYFADMTTEPAEQYGEIQGASLWSYMDSKAEAASTRTVRPTPV